MLSRCVPSLTETEEAIEFTDVPQWAKEEITYLSKAGFDSVYGARPLRRAIQQKIEDSFSSAMLEGIIKAGDTVECVLKDDTIEYKRIDAESTQKSDNTENIPD